MLQQCDHYVTAEYKIVKPNLAVELTANFLGKLSKLKHVMMILTRCVGRRLMKEHQRQIVLRVLTSIFRSERIICNLYALMSIVALVAGC